MIVFVSCGQGSTKWFSGLAKWITEETKVPTEVWGWEPSPLYEHGDFKPTDAMANDAIQWNQWRIENAFTDHEPRVDHLKTEAFKYLKHYGVSIQMAKQRGLETIVIGSSSRYVPRSAVVAAKAEGIQVTGITGGIFPMMDGPASFMISQDGEHCEQTSELYTERHNWRNHETNHKRINAYRAWWLENRRTKHEKASQGVTFKPEFAMENPYVWFIQIPQDAACYTWWLNQQEKEQAIEDIHDLDVYVKGHPYGNPRQTQNFRPSRVIPSKVNIHDVMPYSGGIGCYTSAVGLEAWLYDKDVAVYGRPWYAQNGLVASSFKELQDGFKYDEEERLRFLDYFIFEYCMQKVDGNAQAVVDRLQWR